MTENDLQRTIERVAAVLTFLGIRFHLTGGVASSYYGEPRSTRDAGFVVQLRPGDATPLIDALSGSFLIDAATVRDAIVRPGMFQALDRETMVKADFHAAS